MANATTLLEETMGALKTATAADKKENFRRRLVAQEGLAEKVVKGMDVLHAELDGKIQRLQKDVVRVARYLDKMNQVVHHIDKAINGRFWERRRARKALAAMREGSLEPKEKEDGDRPDG